MSMKLENIGFYTLSDNRAASVSVSSPMWRCELLLTDRCNFSCPYCRGGHHYGGGDIAMADAKKVLSQWIGDGLRNVRFSGGEPTLFPGLTELVSMCNDGGVERIAVSTNGSADSALYKRLVRAGVNDFSISLDACCAQVGNKMSGRSCWERVIDNIRMLSTMTYVSAGMVFTEDNISECKESVLFAHSLGVSDIRVIPSAQYNLALIQLAELPQEILKQYPILQYRIDNIRSGRHVRGMCKADTSRCYLVLDDSAVAGGYHYPCIIYLREGGDPVGRIGSGMRIERAEWMKAHNPLKDPICREMCIDVCVDYNKKVEELNAYSQKCSIG